VNLVACPDCGAPFPALDGPTHAYVGASAECWAAFNELSVRELELGIAGPARLSPHVYMVQHPGTEGRREAQSVGVHLMVLGAVLERGQSTAAAVAAMSGWLRGHPEVPWLKPPSPSAARTIRDLPAQADRATHEAAVRAWAEAVWASRSTQHATIRRWLDRGAPG
jgi:hypothetical protein